MGESLFLSCLNFSMPFMPPSPYLPFSLSPIPPFSLACAFLAVFYTSSSTNYSTGRVFKKLFGRMNAFRVMVLEARKKTPNIASNLFITNFDIEVLNMTTNKSARSYFKMVTLMAVFAIGTVGCDTIDSNDTPSELEERSQRNNPRVSAASIYNFSDKAEAGTSTLKRGADAITLSIATSELNPGYAYTVWWVVFDNPENCTDSDCGSDDVSGAMGGGANLPGVSILGAADGSVVNADGKANYYGSLRKNNASQAILGDGLDNPATAEIHYVIRSHGVAVPGLIEDQITTFNGGCETGQPNVGQCTNVQFAIHKAATN